MNTLQTEYAGVITTRSQSGYVDAFTMSGYRSFDDVVSALRDRARFSTLLRFTGVCIRREGIYGQNQTATVESLEYDDDDLIELIGDRKAAAR